MSKKKVLIITYYWPPAGGPGVQRWLKFCQYLPEFGWKPTVFVPENPSYPITDESLLADIPEDLEMIRRKIWEPYRFAEKLSKNNQKFKGGQFDIGKNQNWKSKLSIWIRGNFFIPDARVFWVKPSVKYLRKYLAENKFDALVTTGPPHSLHLIGLTLKKDFPELKWIADFRDPWTEISYYRHLKLTKSSDRKHRHLEQQVFRTADITVATSFTDAKNFAELGANAVTITNGFDQNEIKQEHHQFNSGKFTISYIGVLEQLRNPTILWQILAEMVTENKDFSKNLELRFAGRIDQKILEEITNLKLDQYVTNLGYLSHRDSVTEMQKSNLLLITNFPDENSKGIIPGKIFEYLAAGNPILSFGPKNADAQRILEETKSGQHFEYSEKEATKKYIYETYESWRNQDFCRTDSPETLKYSRRNLTKQLAQIL